MKSLIYASILAVCLILASSAFANDNRVGAAEIEFVELDSNASTKGGGAEQVKDEHLTLKKQSDQPSSIKSGVGKVKFDSAKKTKAPRKESSRSGQTFTGTGPAMARDNPDA